METVYLPKTKWAPRVIKLVEILRDMKEIDRAEVIQKMGGIKESQLQFLLTKVTEFGIGVIHRQWANGRYTNSLVEIVANCEIKAA